MCCAPVFMSRKCRWRTLGWIATVGVVRAWRRRGLAQALLYQTFGALYARGRRKFGLGVDAASLTGALSGAGWEAQGSTAEQVREWCAAAGMILVRPVLDVAPDLLGRVLVHHTGEEPVALRLTEVEAYAGAEAWTRDAVACIRSLMTL